MLRTSIQFTTPGSLISRNIEGSQIVDKENNSQAQVMQRGHRRAMGIRGIDLMNAFTGEYVDNCPTKSISDRVPLSGISLSNINMNEGTSRSWNYSKQAERTNTTSSEDNPGCSSFVVTNDYPNVQIHNISISSRSFQTLSNFLNTRIFNADDDNWKFQRQVASHKFNTKSLRKFVLDAELTNHLIPIVALAAETQIQTLDFHDILQQFAFDNCKIVFGFNPKYLTLSLKQSKFAQAFKDTTKISNKRLHQPVPII